MNEELQNAYVAALAGLAVTGPRPLFPRVDLQADDSSTEVSPQALNRYLRAASSNDWLRKQFHHQLSRWDAEPSSEPWANNTTEGTEYRRHVVYERLDLPEFLQETFNELYPPKADRNFVIAKEAKEFKPWYTTQRQRQESFYWRAYNRHLQTKPGWEPESVADLDSATTDVLRRLSDPTRPNAYKSKGLVVGYVQSGKTANITGVLAKSIDAGYRLLIVLTGTIELLRQQTQRRIDMELVGFENILGEIDPTDTETMSTIDYWGDPDWHNNKFIKHGARPSDLDCPDIIRLTDHRAGSDYRSLQRGIASLNFETHDRGRPLFDPLNLQYCSARLVVAKKNKTVLTNLIRDLKQIRPRLSEVPALIIDDESDHASVNTSNPSRWKQGQKQRTAINGLISELLGLLPRAQYVGYTATPFANVFIDPSDAEDIFPTDFLLCLTRPPGYMGVKDFHDFDSDVDLGTPTLDYSREWAHVRDLRADKGDHEARLSEIRAVLDMFVTTGAIKLFREQHGSPNFQHHTMLVHESVQTVQHRLLADEIRDAWNSAAFNSPSSLGRLRELYEGDIIPVSAALRENNLPDAFEDLKPFIGTAVSKITETGDPVIIVNSDKDVRTETIDFEKRPVWRVLVGGAKLSRGFTVEGLTVSYYRRRTSQTDALMQMGRWFGFRKGYRDLVRLYIGRAERVGQRTVDLYEAFEAVMRDEEQFRDELRKYSELVDGRPQIRPADVPPLVTQRVPWLRPTARNKMFNARLVVKRSPGVPVEPVAYPKDRADIEHNYDAMLPLMRQIDRRDDFMILGGTGPNSYSALYGIASHERLLVSLRELRWLYADHFQPDLAFFEEISGTVQDWLVLMPQLKRGGSILPDLDSRSVVYRIRRREPLFQAISDPKHRLTARRVAGAVDPYGDDLADALHTPTRGSLIIYPVIEKVSEPTGTSTEISKRSCIVAFTAVAPYSSIQPGTPLVHFEAHNQALAELAIVPDPDADAD